MAQYTIKLVSKREVAKDTWEFCFSKPDGFVFKAGQSMDLFEINPSETDAEGNKRAYSISAAPYEAYLAITTRMRDTAFKRILSAVPEGTDFKMDGPFGDMILVNDTTKPVLIFAGGIGITPFYSMIKQAVHDNTAHKITLFYSNRTPQDAPFLKQLSQLALSHPLFTFTPTVTDASVPETEWADARGIISAQLVKVHADPVGAINYIAGPPTFVAAMRQLLNGLGVNDDYIRTEAFTGYK